MRNDLLLMLDRSLHCPLLAVRVSIIIRVEIAKSPILEALVQATLHYVGQAPLQMANLDISLCVSIWG